MVSQSQHAEWSDHPPVRSNSMLSLDGRQRPQTARTPPSYYDAVRSRHSLSHPAGRQETPKQDKQCFPPHEKYNSLPRPLPQRYAVAMTNGHEKFPVPRGSPWIGSPQNTNGGWNATLTDGTSSSPRSERPPRSHEQPPHEYTLPPGPANPVPQVHLPSRSRDAPPGHLPNGLFPGQYNYGCSTNQNEQCAPYKYSTAVDDGQQQKYGAHFGDVKDHPNQYSVRNSPQFRRTSSGSKQQHLPHIPSQQQQHQLQRIHHHLHPQVVTPPASGIMEMRRPSLDHRRDTESNAQTGRWMRRSYPSVSEDTTQDNRYYSSHSQENSHGHSMPFESRYSRSGILPSRPTASHGADLVLPAPAVSVRTGPLGTYPESRPTHRDYLPPPSSLLQPSSLPEMTNGLSLGDRNDTKQSRCLYSQKEGTAKIIDSKEHLHQSNLTTLNSTILYPNGLPLRKSMSSSTASLCSDASSASSRARRMQNRTNGDSPIKRVPLNTRSKGAVDEVHAHGRKVKDSVLKDMDSVISPSPWAREEKEQLQKQQVQDARRVRDEEIKYLESLPDRTQKQEEILRILCLEREFQKRAEELADGDDEEDDEEDELLERAEHMERKLRMQAETSARSRLKQQANSAESHQQHAANNSSDDWLAKRQMHHLSRIAEENDFHRDIHLANGAGVEKLNEFLENISIKTTKQDSQPKTPNLSDSDCCKTTEEVHTRPVNGCSVQEIKTFNSYEENHVLNGNDFFHAFPVPAPRKSKTHIPPPVPPKSKVRYDSNGYIMTDTFSSPENIEAAEYMKTPVKAESPLVGLQDLTNTSEWIPEFNSPISQTTFNGLESSPVNDGHSAKSDNFQKADISKLYTSSKVRNGFIDSRAEVGKSRELQKLWTSKPEKLTFQDKIRKFSLQAGEEDVPKDKVKNSRAQREIEIKFNEGQDKSAAFILT